MPNRPASRVGAAIAVLIAAGFFAGPAGSLVSQPARSASSTEPGSSAQAAQPQAAAAAPAPQSQQEKEIRAFDELYARDFTGGNTKALVARFTEDAEVIEADGLRYQGRTLIEERLAEAVAASPGAKLVIEVENIRLLSPDVAKEEGRTIVTPAKGGHASHRRYTALLVKRDGNWLLSSVREEHDPIESPHDRLQRLAWLVGDWVDEGQDSVMRVNCRWSDDGNFLFRTFKVKREGKDVMTVSQRIGWDPAARQIRSWEFDSDGGFGEGTWAGDGDRWVIKHTATQPDGTIVSATNTMVRSGAHLVRWTSTDRFVGHEAIADELTYAFVRVPASPPAQSDSPAAPGAANQPERSPK
jgi:uncharacterized protein (TIGR02246 family)